MSVVNFKKDRVTNKVLGTGAFGTVLAYQKDDTDQRWAVKIIKPKIFENLMHCFKEITLGFSCDNPYVLPVKGYLIEHDEENRVWSVYIKLPRMKKSLKDILDDYKSDKKHIPEIEIAQYFYELACGLQYLHGKSIAHRDIKPANMLFDGSSTIKIADFGIGDLSDGSILSSLAEKAGTLSYAAPENRSKDFNLHKRDLFAADLWSLGIVMFELCTQMDLKPLISRDKLEEVLKEKLQELEREGKYSRMLINLICSLLKLRPTERRSLRDVCDDLVRHYGKQLKMNCYSEGTQTNFSDCDQDVRTRMQELEKKIEERNACVEVMKKYYEGIIADLESQIKKISKNELGLSNEEVMIDLKKPKKRDDEIKLERFEEKLSYKEQKPLQQIKLENTAKKAFVYINPLVKEESNRKNFGIFEVQEETENRIVISSPKNNKSIITDECVKELAMKIGTNLKTLQHLSLDFNYCFNITDRSVNELAMQICTNLKALRSLNIVFKGCKNITNQSAKELVKQIDSNLKTLQHLSLNFINTPVSQSVKNDIRFQFKHLMEAKID